ncbi:MAG: Gfo/Idh/MocA family oxidoreductase [Planctomycetes bacterium]|nr:Gfo/Idh/MocA family oxidoreductase [Planctomycetota bacterium]
MSVIGAMLDVVVIGARRVRQGIGEFVARSFHQAGARVRAVVGTSDETTRQAVQNLRARYGLECAGYTALEQALERERPDAVAICSPIPFHRLHLEQVAAFGAHCLAEKPLWWAEQVRDRERTTAALVDAFVRRGRHLALMTPWPLTLPDYDRVHPGRQGRPVAHFEMRLSPVTEGTSMVLDSVSHPLSLLQALVGTGEVRSPRAVVSAPGGRHVRLDFRYVHAAGEVAAVCHLEATAQWPRPAAYALDGRRVERRIELPDYRIFFEGGGRRVALQDPLARLVRRFVDAVGSGAPGDREGLICGMRGLERLMAAAAAAWDAAGGR